MSDPTDDLGLPDPLEAEFRKLEREVRQRECGHHRRTDITEFGKHPTVVCLDCGKQFVNPPTLTPPQSTEGR